MPTIRLLVNGRVSAFCCEKFTAGENPSIKFFPKHPARLFSSFCYFLALILAVKKKSKIRSDFIVNKFSKMKLCLLTYELCCLRGKLGESALDFKNTFLARFFTINFTNKILLLFKLNIYFQLFSFLGIYWGFTTLLTF